MTSAAQLEPQIPPLEPDDNLTRAQFERRYGASPHIKKAELIDGVVYVASPTKYRHGRPDHHLGTWLGVYCARTPGLQSATNTTIRLDEQSEPQLDQCVFLPGGRCYVDEDGYLSGMPDFVVEVANTSSAYDLHQKRGLYHRHGASEYVVYVTHEKRVTWFRQSNEGLKAALAPADGIWRSQTLPGLWLDEAALVAGDLATVLQTLETGLETPEHARFAASLAGQ